MRNALAVFAVFLLILQAAAAGAATPLVDAAWLKANAERPGVVILDIRNALGKGSKKAYLKNHIPGAVYSDYLKAGWRAKVDGVPGQLPPVAQLEALIGSLGIGHDSHVVVVAGGTSALDMGSATRVYWTFKVLGHDAVSILDGGYKAYRDDQRNRIAWGWNAPRATVFTATFRPELVAGRDDVLAAMADGVALIDLRPPAQYRGAAKHRFAKRKGTIPGAVNLPESKITVDGGRFVDAAGLAGLFAEVGLAGDEALVSFCNTGHWASLGWFAKSEILGQTNVRLYDGSMVDWTARPELPVQVGAGQQ